MNKVLLLCMAGMLAISVSGCTSCCYDRSYCDDRGPFYCSEYYDSYVGFWKGGFVGGHHDRCGHLFPRTYDYQQGCGYY